MSLLARYREVLGLGGAGQALVFSLIGRLSLGMTGLAILLLVRQATGSYAAAGAVSAAYAIAFAVASPSRARSADRRGPVRVLLACAVLHPVALLALALLAAADAPVAALVGIAVVSGVTVPPLGAVMRALWAELAQGPTLSTAYSLEAVAVELCFIVGPGLTGLITAVAGAGAAVVASGVMTLVGGLGLARSRAVTAVRPHPDAPRSLTGPLSSSAVRALLLTVFWVGAGFGAVEIALPAFVEEQGRTPSAAGLLLMVWSAGSAVSGLVYGALAISTPAVRQLPALVVALAVGSALPLLAGGALTMGLLLFLYGMTIAPLFTCNSMLLSGAAPAGTTTEAFAWNSSMIFGGFALGSALAGNLVEARGVSAALAVATASGVLALATSLGGLRVVAAQVARTADA